MAAPRLPTMPRNATDVTRILACVDGAIQNVPLSRNAESLQLERTTPVREFCSWPGKRNYEGLHWSSTNRSHVDFESLLEREYLLVADADDDIIAIAAQPLALLWPRSMSEQRNHVPDFFVRLSSGDGRLVDVRSSERVATNTEQFALTRGVCDHVGWQYEVFTGLAPEVSANLRWLAGYRHDRSAPHPDMVEAILGCFDAPIPFSEALSRVRSRSGLSAEIAAANLLHLIWGRQLSVDLHRPLTNASEVWA